MVGGRGAPKSPIYIILLSSPLFFQVTITVGTSPEQLKIEVDKSTPILTAVAAMGIYIDFDINQLMIETQEKKKNAFTVLMKNTELRLPTKNIEKSSKIKMQNKLIDVLAEKKVGWTCDAVDTAGTNFLRQITDALWYIDGNHDTLAERSCHIPKLFSEFEGFNCPEAYKKRRRSVDSLKEKELQTHIASLSEILSCSYMKKSIWKEIFDSLNVLVESLVKYASYLSSQNLKMKQVHSRVKLTTDVEEWKVLDPPGENDSLTGPLIDKIHSASFYETVFLNEFLPSDCRRKHEFIQNVKVPQKCLFYTYSGSKQHMHFLWKIKESDDIINIMGRLKAKVKDALPMYTSRAMRTQFKSKFGAISHTKTAVLRHMYKDLTGDASASVNLEQAELDKRVKLAMEHEDEEVLYDLRTLNNGRVATYESFLDACRKYIENVVGTAVDERRHGHVHDGEVITHMATALSAQTLYDSVCQDYPKDLPLPSVQWLRMQFWPQTVSQSKTNTGNLKIKYMVQARQIRMDHPDVHYGSCYFKYLKEMTIMFKDEAMLVCSDDKHTVKIGKRNA